VSWESDGRDDHNDPIVVVIAGGDREFLSQFREADGLVSSFFAFALDGSGVGAWC
jgi:hypothetical protein